jgi:hypothetical protein
MSEITDFVAKHLIDMLDSALIAHEPELQEDFLAGVRMLTEKTQDWINGKLINAKPMTT